MTGAVAEDDKSRTLPKVDDIYNEIMSTLTPEVRGTIDSTMSSGTQSVPLKSGADSSRNMQLQQSKMAGEKIRHLDDLSDDIRKQVEKTMQEMETRQHEREIEFKEMKRGQ